MDNIWKNGNIMRELGSKPTSDTSASYILLSRQYLLHLVYALLEERGYVPRLQQHVLTKPHLPRATTALTKRKQQKYQATSGTKMSTCSPAKALPKNITSYKHGF